MISRNTPWPPLQQEVGWWEVAVAGTVHLHKTS
jgi:hypothetical protein